MADADSLAPKSGVAGPVDPFDATADGSRTLNSLPRPGPSLCAVALPPCSSVSVLTSDSPMPSPPSARSGPRAPCTNVSKRSGSRAVSIPTPVSRTRSTTESSSRAPVTVTTPPGGV